MRTRARVWMLVAACTAALLLALPGPTSARTAPSPPPLFGASTATVAELAALEAALGQRVGVVSTYADFTDPFPTDWATQAALRDAVLLVAWEPWDSDAGGVTQPRHQLRDITRGRHDRYLRSWLRAAAAHPGPVWVRLMPEMNGDWRPWAMGVNGNGTDGGAYVAAWRYVVSLARRMGADNVEWVFNPIASYTDPRGYPAASFPLADLYPGPGWVDLVALDGFNWGPTRSWGWQTFDDIFTVGLAEIRAVAPDKPLLIAETGCAPGPGKAAWIADTLTRSVEESAVAVAWFERNKETDWRIHAPAGTRQQVDAAAAALTMNGYVRR